MRWIGSFNILYGGTGLAAAFYLGRSEAVLLCLWVIAWGFVLRSRTFSCLAGTLWRRIMPGRRQPD